MESLRCLQITAAEAELAGLISAMLATAESVAAAVREARGRKESCGQDAEQDDPQESSDTYMEAMRPLQFGRSLFVCCCELFVVCLFVVVSCLLFVASSQTRTSFWRRMRLASFVSSLHSTMRIGCSRARPPCTAPHGAGGWHRRCLRWPPRSPSHPPPPSS